MDERLGLGEHAVVHQQAEKEGEQEYSESVDLQVHDCEV